MMLKMGQLGLRCVVKVPKKTPDYDPTMARARGSPLLSRELHSQSTSLEIDQHIPAAN
ncbi:hypothetical protein RHMOL_Rhmol10G0296300 [Rhododendron molle]|uniref:Uncharacterized protein n=1 Tax=Rhododendron molle TaxID=49168 RepID=A0ACC0M7L2_RHOML|nr:hypothetical protein RHMOL_Rhmol10G0296300 [Rhododendron molle]